MSVSDAVLLAAASPDDGDNDVDCCDDDVADGGVVDLGCSVGVTTAVSGVDAVAVVPAVDVVAGVPAVGARACSYHLSPAAASKRILHAGLAPDPVPVPPPLLSSPLPVQLCFISV